MSFRLGCIFVLVILIVELARLNPIAATQDHQQKGQDAQNKYGHTSGGNQDIAIPQTTHSQREQHDAYSTKNHGRSTVGGSPFGIWLKEFHQEILSVFTIAIALATISLAWYTAQLWGATRLLAIDAKESAERQLRAYVFAAHDSPITLYKEKFLSVQIDIKNLGQTPANEVICRASIGLYPYPLKSPLPPEDGPSPSQSPLFTNQIIKQFPTLEKPLAPTDLNAILAKNKAIYVWGKITYVDVFKNQRTTTFCLYCTGDDIDGGNLAYYPDGNKAD